MATSLPTLAWIETGYEEKYIQAIHVSFVSILFELDTISNESDQIKKELELLKNEHNNKPSHMSNYPEKS